MSISLHTHDPDHQMSPYIRLWEAGLHHAVSSGSANISITGKGTAYILDNKLETFSVPFLSIFDEAHFLDIPRINLIPWVMTHQPKQINAYMLTAIVDLQVDGLILPPVEIEVINGVGTSIHFNPQHALSAHQHLAYQAYVQQHGLATGKSVHIPS